MGGSNGCPAHVHLPSSLSSARDELTQSFHRLSVCVYGSNLHGNSEVNLQGCVSLCGEHAPPLPPPPLEPSLDVDYLLPELTEGSPGAPTSMKPDVPYEELWLDHIRSQAPCSSALALTDHGKPVARGNMTPVLQYQVAGPACPLLGSDLNLPPPPVPPKSEAVSGLV